MNTSGFTSSSRPAYAQEPKDNYFMGAVKSTWQCLIICGLSGAAGIMLSAALSISSPFSILLPITLAYIAGITWGMLQLIKQGEGWNSSLTKVIRAEGVSITIMESTEIATELAIPGLITTSPASYLFWIGITSALGMSFVTTLPINYLLIKLGIRHYH